MAEKAATPNNSKITYRETLFGIVETLTNKFTGLSPIDLLNAPTSDVLELWTDTIINSNRQKQNATEGKGRPATGAEMVYSYNATWH